MMRLLQLGKKFLSPALLTKLFSSFFRRDKGENKKKTLKKGWDSGSSTIKETKRREDGVLLSFEEKTLL